MSELRGAAEEPQVRQVMNDPQAEYLIACGKVVGALDRARALLAEMRYGDVEDLRKGEFALLKAVTVLIDVPSPSGIGEGL